MPKVISECLLSQDFVNPLQECLLYYNAGITVLALQEGEITHVGDKMSVIWSIFVLHRLIASAPKMSLFRIA